MADYRNSAAIRPDVSTAARSVANSWPGVIDADDVEQEIWLRVSEKDYVKKLVDMDQPARLKTLRKIGHQVAMSWRDDHEVFSGNAYYGTEDVRAILNRGALGEVKARTDTERMDLEDGLAILRERNRRYVEVIAQRYLEGDTTDDRNPTYRKLLQRAVDELTAAMNRVHRKRVVDYDDGPGTRRVISNSRARHIVSNGGFPS